MDRFLPELPPRRSKCDRLRDAGHRLPAGRDHLREGARTIDNPHPAEGQDSAAQLWPSIARFIDREQALGRWAEARGPAAAALYEFLRFGAKQGWACLFGGLMVALLTGTHLLYPAHAWLYPNQLAGWASVPFWKLGSWFLLMIISYVMVTWIDQPREFNAAAHDVFARAGSGAAP